MLGSETTSWTGYDKSFDHAIRLHDRRSRMLSNHIIVSQAISLRRDHSENPNLAPDTLRAPLAIVDIQPLPLPGWGEIRKSKT